MYNNSTLTAEDIKDHYIRTREDQRIDDGDVIDALNDFYSIVQRLDRRQFPEKYELESASTSVTSSGYDISGLTNIGTFDEGFTVYKNEVKTQNILPRMSQSDQREGYFIQGNTLYLTPNKKSASIIILYQKKTTRLPLTQDLSAHTVEIDQDLEMALKLYIRQSFYDGKYQFDLRADAENAALAEVQRYFDKSPKSKIII